MSNFYIQNLPKYFRTGLIMAVVTVMPACGGSSGGDSPTPDDTTSEPRSPDDPIAPDSPSDNLDDLPEDTTDDVPEDPIDDTPEDTIDDVPEDPIDDIPDGTTDGNNDNDQGSDLDIGKRIPSRVKRVDFDLDNNGVIDAYTEISYDDSGRHMGSLYRYQGDSFPDATSVAGSLAVGIPDPGMSEITSISQYDTVGRLLSARSTIHSSVIGFVDVLFEYDYNQDLVIKKTQKQFNENGTAMEPIDFDYNYTDGYLDNIKISQTDNGIDLDELPDDIRDVVLGATVDYVDASVNDNGLVELLEYYSLADTLATTFQFEWSDQGQIKLYTQFYPDRATGSGYVSEFNYDDNGCLVSELSKEEDSGVVEGNTLTVFTRDPGTGAPIKAEVDYGNDGSVDAVAYYTVEDIPQLLIPAEPDYDYIFALGLASFCQVPSAN